MGYSLKTWIKNIKQEKKYRKKQLIVLKSYLKGMNLYICKKLVNILNRILKDMS